MKKYGKKSKILLDNCLINSDHFDEKYMKTKSNSDGHISLNITLELYNTVEVLRSVFHDCSKYYKQDF